MAEYKKQHYIPQFYLRNFSTDRRRVCLFLLAQKKAIRDVNIKGQCVRDYFYSKDIEVEKALSGLIEGPAHIAIERVLKAGHLPAAGSEDMAKLLSFVLTLQGRTLTASNAMEEVTEHFGRHVIESYTQASGKYTADQLKGTRMRLTQPALMSLVIATQMLPLVMDLKPALLTTNQRDLITSDNPVVAVNPYMQGVWDGSNTGSALAGLQVILPISPQAALFFYDDEVYELVVAAEPSVALSKEDVETLNLLQMANAEHAVYFDDWGKETEIARLHGKAVSMRRSVKSVAKATKMREGSRHSELFRVHRVDLSLPKSVSFFDIRKDYANVPRKERQPLKVRQPELVAMHRAFTDEVIAGRYLPGDFQRFVDNMHGRAALDGPITSIL